MQLNKPTLLILAILSLQGAQAGRQEREAPAPERIPQAKATITGIDEAASYTSIPPVLVELSNLRSASTIWVELYQGPARKNARGVTVESKLIRGPSGVRILDVPGMARAFKSQGTWTMCVRQSNANGSRSLAQRTFQVRLKQAGLDPNRVLIAPGDTP